MGGAEHGLLAARDQTLPDRLPVDQRLDGDEALRHRLEEFKGLLPGVFQGSAFDLE